MQWRWSVAAPLAAGALLLLSVFGGLGGSVAAVGKGPSNVTLVYGVNSEDNWWFPDWTAQYCGGEGQIFNLAYRPLVVIGDNGEIDYGQSVASNITVSKDDTVYTIHIGSQFKWSNGEPVTAYDALYDAQVMLAASTPKAPFTDCGVGIGGLPTDWKTVTAPNAHTLVVTTTKPLDPLWFEENGLAQLVPIPKQVWDKYSNWTQELKWILKVGVNSAAPQFKVVDGPYMYGAFVRDSYETLVKNPHYTGPDPAHIQTITYQYETSEANMWAAALRGTFAELDIPSQYASEREALAREGGYQLTQQQYGVAFDYVVLNFNKQDPQASLLNQLYIRQAMQMAVNQSSMVKLAGGQAFPIYGPIPPKPRTVYYDPAVQKSSYAYNPAAGKRLLEAHGWRMKNGVMTRGKQTLTFTLIYGPSVQTYVNYMELWQRALKQEGIQLNLNPNLETGTIAFTTHKWQLAFWGGGWGYVPDYYPSGDGLFSVNGTANPGDYANSEMTKLINATLAPGTPAQEVQRMHQYELYAAHDLPVIYVPNVTGYMAVKPWLHMTANGFFPIAGLDEYQFWYTTPQ